MLSTISPVDEMLEEVAEFFAKSPTSEQILSMRPSQAAQERVKLLLEKNRQGNLTKEEQWDLDRFGHIERLVHSVRARIRTSIVAQK
jgi:hypothetical protein